MHIADVVSADRDRLEYGDRVFVRAGEHVAAGRAGIPWDNLQADARAELELFGLHLRLPWCYGDGRAYAILRREAAERRGESLVKLTIERRPAAGDEVFGPLAKPSERDRFELLFEPINSNTLGLMREAVREAVSRWEPRVELRDVVVDPDPGSVGAVFIRLDYVVKTTNDRRNLVYPFYVIPREE